MCVSACESADVSVCACMCMCACVFVLRRARGGQRTVCGASSSAFMWAPGWAQGPRLALLPQHLTGLHSRSHSTRNTAHVQCTGLVHGICSMQAEELL